MRKIFYFGKQITSLKNGTSTKKVFTIQKRKLNNEKKIKFCILH